MNQILLYTLQIHGTRSIQCSCSLPQHDSHLMFAKPPPPVHVSTCKPVPFFPSQQHPLPPNVLPSSGNVFPQLKVLLFVQIPPASTFLTKWIGRIQPTILEAICMIAFVRKNSDIVGCNSCLVGRPLFIIY